jgi:hypothetical protein
LTRGLEHAELHGGELFVVHVTNARRNATDSTPDRIADAFARVRRIANRVPNDRMAIRWIMAYGDPAIEVARFIRRTNADLAVVGSAVPGAVRRPRGADCRRRDCGGLVDCGIDAMSDRINTSRVHADSIRRAIALMEAEYREMPGLILTAEQAQRLLGLDNGTCAVALAALTRRRFLKQTSAGAYLRERPG